ncbi:DUF4007 family protein [Limisalsivibrio acetivorans]|uniref:DUF4007 family protein n=1 Tax=Limisalsivibrio acetivorans TaxID=1304888 RepID=UPI0003F8F325|nr:DUF4007 family protein [Limisalsivibrio acetivorans]
MTKLIFSGHESFYCRFFWLKKGYEFLVAGNKFNSEDAVISLGVGKNMVASIRYWMEAFGLTKETELTELAHLIFADDVGLDPYLEHKSTLWILHLNLIMKAKASLYYLVFNEFRKQRIEFTKEHLNNFIVSACFDNEQSVSEKIIKTDIGVFIKTYLSPSKKSKNFEDDYTTLFHDLRLIREMGSSTVGSEAWYTFDGSEANNINPNVALYGILSNSQFGDSITFNDILNGNNGLGQLLCLGAKDLLSVIEKIVSTYNGITFTEDAGVKLLQIKDNFPVDRVLRACYE